MKRRATIMEVAKLAGVSFKTVSRVVNNEPSVKADKRAAVLNAMRMLDYTPNISARQLASNRSFLIALLFDIPVDYVVRAQAGAVARCREAGYHLVVEEMPQGFETEIANRLQQLRVDGVIVAPPLSHRETVRSALRERGLPYVLLAPEYPDPTASSVGMDDEAAGLEATRHLIDLGHRDIAFIGAASRPASVRRHAGYLRALAEAGLPRRPEYEAEGDFFFASGERAGDALLARPDPPTAIFAANDAMALGAMVSAARRGVRAPEDLSVAGFDDSASATVVSPQLTTVRQPLAAMTAAAVDLLIERTPPPGPQRLELPFELIVRGSTGPAARR
ncbi:MAG: LacI family DNA-binding transcriptional regulator [Phenylobacterium sp.]|nr:LacI family DNA-binding transcriptional regulator [Phenylobacterium sp.]MBL8556758.1 LacI family DNA-binding transcriptional regulator [Phenylobacterium sp.]